MNLRLTALAVAVLLLPGSAIAQQRSPLEIGEDYVEAVAATGAGEARADGTPRALYRLDYAVRSASPEAMAREFLSAYASTLRLVSPALDDLVHVHTRTGRAGHSVRFFQTVGGVTVYGSEIAVNVDPRDRVQLVFSTYQPGLMVETTPAVTAEAARTAVAEHLGGLSGTLHLDETALVVYPMESGARLAWQVRLAPDQPSGDWEAFVDARTGALLRVADRTIYERGWTPTPATTAPASTQAPSFVPAPALPRRIDGTGMIFDPDPLTRAGVPYGTPGYVDGGDANTPELEAARTAVTLRDITFDGAQYQLQGPWAYALDWDLPFSGIFPQPTPDWSFTRDHGAFEWATTYWHIDNYMRYLNVTLGVSVIPHQYTTGVHFDAHGFNGADNSSYSGGTGNLRFGEGCVDDAEDADVILHELG
ncbi:MAG TPA: hypothetical protein VD962_01635, partial [Rubricoccaceae bacterium]|nr:hypothetical protein [Rubricoccaceae bacterium]